MTIRLFFAWYDAWVGAYIPPDKGGRVIYLCPLPCVVIKITRAKQ